jgi:soluble lytic murein transglycosylase-like protein
MTEPKTSRPFQERFLDGFDRHELRQEVQKVKPSPMAKIRRKYATWALGGALALGGLGVPLKMATATHAAAKTTTPPANNPAPDQSQIAGDLATARQIADQVSTGVTGAVQTVAQTAVEAPKQIAQTVAEAPQEIVQTAEAAKENFFKTQIPFGSLIYSEAKKNNLPPELVAAVAHTESKFQPTAHSGAGAIGLMQLVPKTGRWLGARNLTDPAQNVMAGAKYLRYLTDRFNGDQQKAIAAYNAGEGAVRRFGGVPPYRETRNYVQRVTSFQQDLGNQIADVRTSNPGL